MAYDFEPPGKMDRWAGYSGTPIKLVTGAGAFGSKGYLQVGPHTGHWVGVHLNTSVVATPETWVGFSMRVAGGGTLEFSMSDQKQKKNVGRRYKLAEDGSWTTLCFPLRHAGAAEDAPIANLQFYLPSNRQGLPLTFDLDNVVIGVGKPSRPPTAPGPVTAKYADDAVRLDWPAPAAPCGLAEYRVYRGLHADFDRDERHLMARVQEASYSDEAFAHRGRYFYAVRGVDFVGNEGPDAGAVEVEVP
jgi:hypothetical protein